MSSARLRVVATTVSLLVAAGVTAPSFAGAGPALLDTHDSYVPARGAEVTSSAAGTVYTTDAGTGIFGHVYLVRSPMTTGSAHVDLGERATSSLPAAAPSISGTRVAVPESVGLANPEPPPVSSVRYCAAVTCPTMSTFTVPSGWRYVGNADDRAVLYNEAADDVALAPWDGSTMTVINWTGSPPPDTATGDANGVVFNGGGTATYLSRPGLAFSDPIDANLAVLTPTFVVWYLVATGPSFDVTAVRQVTRSNPNAPYNTLATLAGAPDFNTFAANDSGAAWLVPQDDGSNLLYSLPAAGGTPVLYPRNIDSTGLTAFEGGANFLVNDRRAGIPGFYRVAPGSTGGTLTGLLPVRQAITYNVAVSNKRAVYADDMTDALPVFLRGVANGVPDSTESTVSADSTAGIDISGPYVVVAHEGGVVTYGRTGGTMHSVTLPVADVGRVANSGRRVLVTAGVNSRLIDAVTNAQTSLGHVYAALFGDYLVTLNYDTGVLARKNLATGVVQTIRGAVAGCTTFCVDEEGWQLSVWGNEVAYAYRYGGTTPGLAKGIWDGNTNTTVNTLPMLGTFASPTYYEFRYWDGLLLLYRNDFTIHLYETRNANADHLVESFGDAPMDLDGHVVAWRRLSDERVVVRDVTDFVPGYGAAPRYLGADAPAGFGSGSPAGAKWKPTFLVSQDVTGSLEIHSGSVAGPLVRSIPVNSVNGAIEPTWDGTNASATPQPQGTYYWRLTGTSTGLGAFPLKDAAGTASAVTGSVYLSTAPLAAPVMTAPTLSTETSASTTFSVSWSIPAGAPAGTRYNVQRSANGGAYAAFVTGTASTTAAMAGTAGTTYRFKVAAVDPSGRVGTFSAVDSTVVPYDDTASGTTYAGSWPSTSNASLYRGSHHSSSAAGATYSFKATGTTIYLIGIKAASYGQFQVSIDGGAYSGYVDAYRAGTAFRQVLYTRSGLTNALHTIKVRVYGTAGRPTVGIDGVGYLR